MQLFHHNCSKCQIDIAEQIVKQIGDYLLAFKAKQGHFHEEVVLFLTIAKKRLILKILNMTLTKKSMPVTVVLRHNA